MNSSANTDHFCCSNCRSSSKRLDNISSELFKDKDYKTKEFADELIDDRFENDEIVINFDSINSKHVNEKKNEFNKINYDLIKKNNLDNELPHIIKSNVNVPSFDLNRKLFEERIKESSRLIKSENGLRTKRILKDKLYLKGKIPNNDVIMSDELNNKTSLEPVNNLTNHKKPVELTESSSIELNNRLKMNNINQIMKLHRRLNETNKQEIKIDSTQFDTDKYCQCNLTNYAKSSNLVQTDLNITDNNCSKNLIRIDENKILKAIMKKNLISELEERQKANQNNGLNKKSKNYSNLNKDQLVKDEKKLIDYSKYEPKFDEKNRSNLVLFKNNQTKSINSQLIKDQIVKFPKLSENYINKTKLDEVDEKFEQIVYHVNQMNFDKEADKKKIISEQLNLNSSKVMYDERKNKQIQTNQIIKKDQSTQTEDKRSNKIKYKLLPIKNPNLTSKIIDEILVSRSQLY